MVEKGRVVLTRGVVVSRAGVHKYLHIDSANVNPKSSIATHNGIEEGTMSIFMFTLFCPRSN